MVIRSLLRVTLTSDLLMQVFNREERRDYFLITECLSETRGVVCE